MTLVEGVMLHYGCRQSIAVMLLAHDTTMAKAVRFFGPLRCYYSKQKESWTLDQRKAEPRTIIERWHWWQQSHAELG
ncbi:MAG: hypothetical protein GY906_24200 [bacterium]|nr:hypothetical protein [bacterium]